MARAETTSSVAIWCGFLVPYVGAGQACDGLHKFDIELLAINIGDRDGRLEPGDLAQADLDANQITDENIGTMDEIYVIAFTDADGVVTFDAPVGVNIIINRSSGGFSLDPDGNPETCSGVDDEDCDPMIMDDGDGVVVATASSTSVVNQGDALDVDVYQADAPDTVSTQTLHVVGRQFRIDLVIVETSIQRNADGNCSSGETGVLEPEALSDHRSTLVIATVVDNDDRALTRSAVDFSSNNQNVAEIGAETGVTVDTGTGAGIAALAVICGSDDRGTVIINADIGDDDDKVSLAVRGEPAHISLQASDSDILCDGTESTSVTATVTDIDGNPAGQGTMVTFQVFAAGVVVPNTTYTIDGVASTIFSGVSAFTQGVPVYAMSGVVQNSILIICQGFDTDGDGLPNAFESAHACLNPSSSDSGGDPDSDALTSLQEFGITTNPCLYDSDVDGCGDGVETNLNPALGGQRDPTSAWDFFDVPAPALSAGDASGTRDGTVNLADVLAIVAYAGSAAGGPPNPGGYDYDGDLNLNGVADGMEYDRTPSLDAAKPWRSGAPNGAVTLSDALVALSQAGHACL